MKILLLLINILVFINSLNYYEILEIPKTASTYTIKKAFRQLSKKFHPDKNRSPGSAEKY